MHILLVSATRAEIAPLEHWLRESFVTFGEDQYQRGPLQVSVLRTGVGLPMTAFALGQVLATRRFDLAVQAGLAGAFSRELALGDVVQVLSERFADLGVEERDGSFTDVHELGLLPPDQPPFEAGVLRNAQGEGFAFLPAARGISVNTVHGYPPSIERARAKYPADVESMEGAAFFYACLLREQPFLEVRAISNYVEARDRSSWRVEEAIEALNRVLIDMLQGVQGAP